MTARLYLEHPRYRHHLEAAAEALLPYTGTSVVDLIVDGDVRVHQTGFTQPTLFAVQYALTAALADAGVRPRAVIGHSIGEFAASVATGALELAEAATLVATRGVLMQYLPTGGGMLAVSAAARDVEALVAAEPDVGFGAFNGPASVTLSGELRALERIAEELAARSVRSTALQVSHAFHSDLMRPMLGTYTRVAAQVRHGIPRIPFYSTVRGRPLKPGEALDTGYWIRHITEPVRFAPAAARLLGDLRPAAVVEIGPKPVLTGLLRKIADPQDAPALLPACRTRTPAPRSWTSSPGDCCRRPRPRPSRAVLLSASALRPPAAGGAARPSRSPGLVRPGLLGDPARLPRDPDRVHPVAAPSFITMVVR